ncbi:MAG: cobalamin-independent methionine synthase II family protein [Actinomycetota bacterium]|jgi:5-methyltetrahydropteroyltriglutamate--homocysteine methyltransferase|nr:cobalamin-independent methionine synthase II family protein [Actinomycetota bacterium]
MALDVQRVLTTHAGSLPRPAELIEQLAAWSRNELDDPAAVEDLVEAAVARVIERQLDAGVDVGNDGEQSRESFFTYVQHRMSGFGPGDQRARSWQDMADFPEFIDMLRSQSGGPRAVSLGRPPQAVSEVSYGSTDAIDRDIERLTRHQQTTPFVDTFMTAPSPGIIATAMVNRHYDTEDAYLAAVADAVSVEYRRIIDAGFLLQIDAPDLAMERHGAFAARPDADFLGFVESVVGAINRSVAGLPAERIRLHVCWGNYDGPHIHDIALASLLPALYRAQVGGLLLSGANPRHEHEYREFERQPLPDGWVLSAGVIDTTTNYVEHPEVVADRLERVARAVGDPTRVIASTDCGFDTAAGFRAVAPDVAWAKLAALRAGADLATQRLF